MKGKNSIILDRDKLGHSWRVNFDTLRWDANSRADIASKTKTKKGNEQSYVRELRPWDVSECVTVYQRPLLTVYHVCLYASYKCYLIFLQFGLETNWKFTWDTEHGGNTTRAPHVNVFRCGSQTNFNPWSSDFASVMSLISKDHLLGCVVNLCICKFISEIQALFMHASHLTRENEAIFWV